MNPISSLPLALPGRTFRLFGRYWLPLVVWYLLGRGLHDALIEVAARVNGFNSVIAFSIVAIAILCLLAAFVFMFQSVQPGLPTIWSLRKRDAELDLTIKSPDRRTAREQLSAVGRALLPLLLVYAAWGLFEDDQRRVDYRTWELYAFGEGYPQKSEFTLWFAAAAVVAYVLVKVFEFVTRRTNNPVTALLAAVCEANWMFFAIFGIKRLLLNVTEVFSETTAGYNVFGVLGFFRDVGPALPIRVDNVFSAAFLDFGWLSMFQEPLRNGVAIALSWLAIAGVCYGREMEDVRGLVDSRRFRRFTGRWDQAPAVVKRYARRFPPDGFKEKYYPPFHAIRLLLTASGGALLFFGVCYSALDLGAALALQTITTIIGPHSAGLFWDELQPVISVGVETVFEALRICLLAVTFDLAMSKFTTAKAQAVGGTGDAARSAEKEGVPVS